MFFSGTPSDLNELLIQLIKDMSSSPYKPLVVWLADSVGKLSVIILGAYLAYYFANRSYRRQKSLEECRKKYLDEGLELCHAELSKILASVEYNWTIAMNLLRHFRPISEHNLKFSRTDIKEAFTIYFPQDFGFGYLDRVNRLVGDNIITRCMFTLFANLNGFSSFLKNDLDVAIEKFMNEPEFHRRKTSGQLAQEAQAALAKQKESLEQYHALREYVSQLTELVRRKQISYETFEKIKEDVEIKEIIQAIRERYKPGDQGETKQA